MILNRRILSVLPAVVAVIAVVAACFYACAAVGTWVTQTAIPWVTNTAIPWVTETAIPAVTGFLSQPRAWVADWSIGQLWTIRDIQLTVSTCSNGDYSFERCAIQLTNSTVSLGGDGTYSFPVLGSVFDAIGFK